MNETVVDYEISGPLAALEDLAAAVAWDGDLRWEAADSEDGVEMADFFGTVTIRHSDPRTPWSFIRDTLNSDISAAGGTPVRFAPR